MHQLVQLVLVDHVLQLDQQVLMVPLVQLVQSIHVLQLIQQGQMVLLNHVHPGPLVHQVSQLDLSHQVILVVQVIQMVP